MRHAPWEEAVDFAIGLRPIEEARWLEGGEAHPALRKDALLAAYRDLVWAEADGSREAQAEVLSLVETATGVPTADSDLPPLLSAARLVPDDLVLMERRDGAWRIGAISLTSPTFFTAAEVAGKSLAELHEPVAGFADRFLARVVRIFDRLRPELILERR
ncbi:MAG TPA: heme-dependent oxidative N-demethylase subunit alpha family protein, partial [Phenylobacterium sp.]